MAGQEIVVQQAKSLTRRKQTPEESGGGLMASIIKLASNPNVDIGKLKELLEMQRGWEIHEDKKAMRHGMAEFKKNPPAIIKSRLATVQTKAGGTFTYSFADLENITTEAQKGLAAYGITHGYAIVETPNLITVTCILKYGAYEEPGVPLSAGPDTSGTKNDIQAKASTVSYLEKYTFLAAVGMAAGMPDTDGHAPPKAQPPAPQMDADEYAADMEAIKEATTREMRRKNFEIARDHAIAAKDNQALGAFHRAWGMADIGGAENEADLKAIYTEHYVIAQKANDKEAMSAYIAAKNKRKSELA